jgi:hypothetical protein
MFLTQGALAESKLLLNNKMRHHIPHRKLLILYQTFIHVLIEFVYEV